jgi:hypothetical protein
MYPVTLAAGTSRALLTVKKCNILNSYFVDPPLTTATTLVSAAIRVRGVSHPTATLPEHSSFRLPKAAAYLSTPLLLLLRLRVQLSLLLLPPAPLCMPACLCSKEEAEVSVLLLVRPFM